MELKDKVHKALPVKASKAITCAMIADMVSTDTYEVTEVKVRKTIKWLRASWIPITWNYKWSYITYDKKELKIKQKQIDNAKAWFAVGMNKIKNVYQWVIDKSLTHNTIW